jgi:cellulose biosynthesis protein BcsQ
MDVIEQPGQIVTFYSYKGGTGRSMALANVACLLARRQTQLVGKPVLMVDWDLEAPGLHRFFRDQFKRAFGGGPKADSALDAQPGLIDLFSELAAADLPQTANEEALDLMVKQTSLDGYLLETDVPNLFLLKAGRFDERYSHRVNTFNWEYLYERSPGLIRTFAEHLLARFQYVLIDSRTGLTDTSGICTMLLPDKLVVVFTPNYQSLLGGIDLAREAVTYRKQSDDLRSLIVFPLASRIELNEDDLRKRWRSGSTERGIIGYEQRFQTLFEQVYHPDDCQLRAYFDEVQIPQTSRYAYGEEIAVLVDAHGDSLSITRRYESFVSILLERPVPWAVGTAAPLRGTATADDHDALSVGPSEPLGEPTRPTEHDDPSNGVLQRRPAGRRVAAALLVVVPALLIIGALARSLLLQTDPAAVSMMPTLVGTPLTTPSATGASVVAAVTLSAVEWTATPTQSATPTPTSQDIGTSTAVTIPVQQAPSVTPSAQARLRVVAKDGTFVNLREQPSLNASIVSPLFDGISVDVIGPDVEADGQVWRHVRNLAGTTGWVSTEFLGP